MINLLLNIKDTSIHKHCAHTHDKSFSTQKKKTCSCNSQCPQLPTPSKVWFESTTEPTGNYIKIKRREECLKMLKISSKNSVSLSVPTVDKCSNVQS